jgi:two-component system LytT family response regulator
MRVLIIDDEPLAHTALTNVIATREDVEGLDSAGDAIEALEKLDKSPFDVLLLDISMPEMSGIELLDRLKQKERPIPSVIFVTAHEEHAIAAFERQAVDYVLKPFTKERISEALNRALRRSAAERAAKLLELLPLLQKSARRPSGRIAIKAKGRILFIDPGEVISVHAEGNYVLLQKGAGSYLLRESLSDVANKLKEYGFIRIHRSVLVNSSFVEEIRPLITGEYALRVRGGKEYTVTRTYKNNLKSLAEFWIGSESPIKE